MSIKVKNIEFVIDDEDDENNEDEKSEYSTTMYTILAPRYIKSSGIVQKLCAFDEIYKAEIM